MDFQKFWRCSAAWTPATSISGKWPAAASETRSQPSVSPPGELCGALSETEYLPAKPVELSQAMAHDWTGFMRAVEQ